MRFFANEEREFTIMCEVMEKAEEKVRSRSKLSTLAGLVLDGQISTKDAAAKASVKKKYKAYISTRFPACFLFSFFLLQPFPLFLCKFIFHIIKNEIFIHYENMCGISEMSNTAQENLRKIKKERKSACVRELQTSEKRKNMQYLHCSRFYLPRACFSLVGKRKCERGHSTMPWIITTRMAKKMYHLRLYLGDTFFSFHLSPPHTSRIT